jgi:hypothetical protein
MRAVPGTMADDSRTSAGIKTVKNPYDQVVNNAINSQQEIHSKENSPESHHSPATSLPGTEDPNASADSPSKNGSPEPMTGNPQSVKMDAEMFMDGDVNPSQILEEVGSMDSWSAGLKDRVRRVEDAGMGEVSTGEVEIDPGASTINLKDS